MRSRWFGSLVFAFIWLTAIGCGAKPASTTTGPVVITVSAAADLQDAFSELGPHFEKKTGVVVHFNFGASGQLAQQIQAGAPVDLFAAANIAFVDKLEKQNLILPETKAVYARGRLAIWTRADSPLALLAIADLAKPEVKRLAIANPKTAPYGQAAKEALEKAGLWKSIEPKIVFGENIRQTMQFAETGNVDAAIVSLSLTSHAKGKSTPIPAELHSPIDQGLAVIRTSKQEAGAKQFAAFVLGDEGRTVLAKFGFELPANKKAP
jgi:molybdate transport system substrate-binding protein